MTATSETLLKHANLNEAAPGVIRHDVEAVNDRESRPLYESRKKVYPKRVYGTFRNVKWALMAVTLGIYYGLPWLRWNRGPDQPDQAFLLDLAHQRLYFGPLDIWAQEFYYITGILIISALGLFLVTSVAGRVWCGYACPQTIWTDLMIAVERFWQGDRNSRMRLVKAPWTMEKLFKKIATHLTWLLIGIATGGALVFYFRDAPTLAGELVAGNAPFIAYLFLFLFAFTTYLLGGIAREQVCIYMCPWPRIQGAMFDSDSLLVSYRSYRGEPRGAHKKGQSWENRGDCIDCKQCVVVCPMGIDIRQGPQLECIQCALCIDACDAIMTKIGRPKRLIAYETFRNIESSKDGRRSPLRLVRPRTVLYAALIPVILAIMLFGLSQRNDLQLTILRDRNPLYVKLSDGAIRNGYTVKLLNKQYETRQFKLNVSGLRNPTMTIVGFKKATDPVIEVKPSNLRSVRLYVSLDKSAVDKLTPETEFMIQVRDLKNGSVMEHPTTFRRP